MAMEMSTRRLSLAACLRAMSLTTLTVMTHRAPAIQGPRYCNSVDDNLMVQLMKAGSVDAPNVSSMTTLMVCSAYAIFSCEQPENHVLDNTDCDDNRDLTNPDADEYCNGYDDNCDQVIDENNALDSLVWYFDFDLDGYGNPWSAVQPAITAAMYWTIQTAMTAKSQSIRAPRNTAILSMTTVTAPSMIRTLDAQTWYQGSDTDTYGNQAVSTLSCARWLCQ